MVVPETRDEQSRVLRVIDSFRLTQLRTKESLAKLTAIKTSLMQDLLTGKKRVTPLLQIHADN